MTLPEHHDDDTAADRIEARRALIETRRSQTHATAIIDSAVAELGLIRAHRERNHFTDKFRAAIQRGA